MIRVSPQLYALSRDYLDLVARGDLSEERSWLHDKCMTQMRVEGITYRNRNHARELMYWFTPESSLVIAYWSLLLDFLGESLDELGTTASLQDVCQAC